MALDCLNKSDAILAAMVTSFNQMRKDLAGATATSFHADVTSTTSGDFSHPVVTFLTANSTNAVDLPTSIALANELKKKYNIHRLDAIAHKVADTTNAVTTADATDLTSVEALLNAIKTAFNAHLTQTGVHYNNDATNTVATTNAIDLPTSEALANSLKTAYNAHIKGATGGYSINLIGP